MSTVLAWLAGWKGYALVLALGLAAGLAVGALVAALRRRRTVPPRVAAPAEGLTAETRALVDGLIATHDLAAGSEALRAHVESVLHRAGVERVEAIPRAPVDSARHQVVGTEGSSGGVAGPVITREVRAGWRTDAVLIRPADVMVSSP